MKSRPNSVANLISSSQGRLRQLIDKMGTIEALNDTLADKLDATFISHCKVVNLRENIMVIAVDSPAWANRMRYQLPDLLSAFRQEGYFSLVRIELTVKPL